MIAKYLLVGMLLGVSVKSAASVAECTGTGAAVTINMLSNSNGATHEVILKRSGFADQYVRAHELSLGKDLALIGDIATAGYQPLKLVFSSYSRAKSNYDSVSLVTRGTEYDSQSENPKDVTHEYKLQCAISQPFSFKNFCGGKSGRQINGSFLAAAKFSDADLVEQSIACGADINSQDSSGCTALMSAIDDEESVCKSNKNPYDSNVFSREDYIATRLLELGAYYDTVDNVFGRSAFHRSVNFINNGDYTVLKSLISVDANINLQDKYGFSPVMFAAKRGMRWAVEALLEGKPDLTLKDRSGKTAYDLGEYLPVGTRDKLAIASIEIVIEGKSDGSCSPLSVVLPKDQRVRITFKGAGSMFTLSSPAFEINMMIGSGQTASQTIEAKKSGTFSFECGVHGGKQNSGQFIVK